MLSVPECWLMLVSDWLSDLGVHHKGCPCALSTNPCSNMLDGLLASREAHAFGSLEHIADGTDTSPPISYCAIPAI
jgi:hypothetical protein